MKKTIPQALLEKYKHLFEQEKKYKVQRDALRDQLIALLRHGAAVEHGVLTARLLECSSISLSKAKVIEAFGQARYDQIRSKIQPTIQVQLRVQERNKGKTHASAIKGKSPWIGEPTHDDWM
ncbi:MAG: hypothetical protein WCJ35_02370 [Planctomycetota bacterium]